MTRQKSIDQLTTAELRSLLMEKSRAERKSRLDHFRRTGRVLKVDAPVSVIPLAEPAPRADSPEEAPRSKRSRRSRIAMDRFLFAVEILAVIGLVFILLNGANLLRTLNTEVVSALNVPEPTPTPLIMAVVLPSGHTPPVSGQEARFNEAEIPEHLRPLVQTMASVPVPTTGPETARNIRIPAINVDQVIVQGDGWEQLKKGVGQHIGSANPGKDGNMVLSAHNDIYGETFRSLDKLAPGDEVIIATSQREYVYLVDQVQVVAPTRVDLMENTREAVVTLISCYPYLVDDQRIVVTAHLRQDP